MDNLIMQTVIAVLRDQLAQGGLELHRLPLVLKEELPRRVPIAQGEGWKVVFQFPSLKAGRLRLHFLLLQARDDHLSCYPHALDLDFTVVKGN